MTIDEYIQAKIDLETRKIKALKRLWLEEILEESIEYLQEDGLNVNEETGQLDLDFETWENEFYDPTSSLGTHVFNEETNEWELSY